MSEERETFPLPDFPVKMSHKFTASSPLRLGDLFSACDLDGSGFIDENELASFCSDLSADEVADVFKELDRDRDGRISISEFSDGFREFTEHLSRPRRSRRKERFSSEEPDLLGVVDYQETMEGSMEFEEGGESGDEGEMDEVKRFQRFIHSVDEGFKALSW